MVVLVHLVWTETHRLLLENRSLVNLICLTDSDPNIFLSIFSQVINLAEPINPLAHTAFCQNCRYDVFFFQSVPDAENSFCIDTLDVK